MDDGRRWALETFGTYGPRIRDEIAGMVKAEHEASLDAQEASGHLSRSVYGEFWRGILEKFEVFGGLPGGALVRPGEAPYKIPVVNGVALFPWRYARSQEAELRFTRFGVSGTRLAITSLRPPATQGTLDLNLPDAGLTEEDQELLAAFDSATRDPVVTTGRLVVVAVASSTRGLFAIDWGEMALVAGSCLDWVGFHESLLPVQLTRPVSTSPTTTFTSGQPPRRLPHAGGDTVAASGDE